MREIEKKLEELKHRISMVEFGSPYDSKLHKELTEQFKELNKDRFGWYVEITPNFNSISNEPNYLSSDSILCISDDPTYFETKEEAEEYLSKAELNSKNWNTEIKEKNNNEKIY